LPMLKCSMNLCYFAIQAAASTQTQPLKSV
jgi:hypothetical protein